MNHLFRIVLVLGLAALGVTILIMANNHANPRPAYELAVEQYVFYRRAMTRRALTIEQYVEARMPQNFRPELSLRSFGDAVYYMTDQVYGASSTNGNVWGMMESATPTPTVTSTPTVAPTAAPGITLTLVPTVPIERWRGSGRPLPYPPNDVWCAKLGSPDPDAPTVVLAVLHQDMYNAEWVVHEVTDPAAALRAVGCQFSNQ